MTAQHMLEPHRQRTILSKVPEVTIYFWVIKVLCTTVGETAADFLNVNLNFGLTGTSVVTGLLLAVVLVVQFRADRYLAGRYWLSVALVSVFGTLVTDNLSDQAGVPLEASTLAFAVLLGVTFLMWYRREGTLSIHSIVTTRREAFYWLAILFTFALGTAAGDLMAEVLGLGYLPTGLIVGGVITATAVAWRLGLHPVLAFWIIYILTRPLGASIGDYLTQSHSQGGLGLGATTTSIVFVIAIAAAVIYLAVTKADVITVDHARETRPRPGGPRQTVVVLGLLLVCATVGYQWRKSSIQQEITDAGSSAASGQASQGTSGAPASPLGDLTPFRTITQDTLNLINAGKQSAATTRIGDLETAWDNAEAQLKPRDKNEWTTIDKKIDTVLRELRATSPHLDREKAALADLLAALNPPRPVQVPAVMASPLGDLTPFRTITQDTLNLINAGKQSAATTRIGDLETAWDNAEAQLKPRDKNEWTTIDKKIDTVLRELRATSPHLDSEKTALTNLLAALR